MKNNNQLLAGVLFLIILAICLFALFNCQQNKENMCLCSGAQVKMQSAQSATVKAQLSQLWPGVV